MKRIKPDDRHRYEVGDIAPGKIALHGVVYHGDGNTDVVFFRVSRSAPTQLDDGRVYENPRRVWIDAMWTVVQRSYDTDD